jgi:hypothetical protein
MHEQGIGHQMLVQLGVILVVPPLLRISISACVHMLSTYPQMLRFARREAKKAGRLYKRPILEESIDTAVTLAPWVEAKQRNEEQNKVGMIRVVCP